MARISFEQVNAIPDILDQTGFELVMGSIPISGGTEDLTIKCQNVSIPGMSTEAWEAMMHGHVKRFRGRKVYPRQLSATFYEDSLFRTHAKLRAWLEFIAGSESGNSQGFQEEYSVTAELRVYNTVGDLIVVDRMEHFYPQDLQDVQLDGSSSQGVSVSCTFSYDRFLSNVTPIL